MYNIPENLIHIALVGPPASGKSTAFEYLSHTLTSCKNTVYFFAKEASTEELESNPKQANLGLPFQFKVFSRQIGAIEKAIEYALQHPDQTVITLSDRCAFDGYIYLNESERKAINWQFFTQFYHAFLLFDLPVQYINSLTEGNQYRKETDIEQLKLLDYFTKEVYESLVSIPLYKIPPFNEIQKKNDFVLSSIEQAITNLKKDGRYEQHGKQ